MVVQPENANPIRTNGVRPRNVFDVDEIDLISVVSPTPELHGALLLVKGEELDVDGAGRLVDGGRLPNDLALWIQSRLGHERHFVVPVRVVV